MRVIVLLSCMHQKDRAIVADSNIQTDAIIINQCEVDKIDEFNFINSKGKSCCVKMIYTTERGLSRSRNMAIQNAEGDICYICDDDEKLLDGYEDLIVKTYERNSRFDVITFALTRKNYTYPKNQLKMGIREILKTSSVQITFKLNEIRENSILFDSKMGSGSGNGGGEENKFLMDCRKKGLKMLYVPEIIARVKSEESQWFQGFTEKYFKDTFWAARRSMGAALALCYIFYWCIFRSGNYDIKISKLQMIKSALKGYFEKR